LRNTLLAATALAGLLLAGPASAVQVTFSGTAAPGTDPLGHTYVTVPVNFYGPGTPAAWGMPGLGFGELSFNPLNGTGTGTSTSATGFTFTVTAGLAGQIVDLSADLSGTALFPTIFVVPVVFNDVVWTPTLSPDGLSVSFTAPAGETLDPGEQFFVNVVFNAEPDMNFAWTATWTGPDTAAVPAPAGLALFGAGLLGLAALRRRA
jgi:hypothetical protein